MAEEQTRPEPQPEPPPDREPKRGVLGGAEKSWRGTDVMFDPPSEPSEPSLGTNDFPTSQAPSSAPAATNDTDTPAE